MIAEEDIRRLKAEVSIEDVLRALGCRTDHRRYMYFSPFRDERTPSMSVSLRGGVWQWFDHGEGTGSSIELVRRLRGCGFRDAVEFLSDIARMPLTQTEYASHSPQSRSEDGCDRSGCLEVENVGRRFTRFSLIGYIESRGIGLDLAERYCREVTYRNLANGRSYNAVGFPNGEGGWVLRNASFKGTTRSGVSSIGTDGRPAKEPTATRVAVFEGFFNFLSWLQMEGRTVPACDVLVLNSVTNALKAAEFIRAHRECDAYLDNDRTGRECLQRLKAICHGTEFRDRSSEYRGHNDLNDLLVKGNGAGEEPPAIHNQHKL